MPRRATISEEWKSHKDVIVRLYKHENKSLLEVVKFMEGEFGFTKTKAQYERMLKNWGITKNSNAHEWDFIVKRYNERALQKRLSIVEIRGTVIADAKVKKELARYGYQTTIEKAQSALAIRHRIETPPGIRVFTPPPSSPIECGSTAVIPCSPVLPLEPVFQWTKEAFFQLAEGTPWRHFTQSLHSLALIDSNPLFLLSNPSTGSLAEETSLLSPTCIDVDNDVEFTVAPKDSYLQKWTTEMLWAKYMTTDFYDTEFKVLCQSLRPDQHLPPIEDDMSNIDIDATADLTTRSTQLEFLKYAVYLLSNNFDRTKAGPVIVELAQNEFNLSLLHNLLNQKLLSTNAFLENLLLPAVELSNIPLLEMIAGAGCDLNKVFYEQIDMMTSLQVAIEQRDEQVASFLLANGANCDKDGLTTYRHLGKHYNRIYHFDSLLDLAIEVSVSMARVLLRPMPQHGHRNPRVTLQTLRLAIYHGHIDMLRFLLYHEPELLKQARNRPWILLEMMARHWDTRMFCVAASTFKLDVSKMDGTGKGSALAAAAASGNISLVRRLYEMGTNINNIAFGYDGKDLFSEWRPQSLHTCLRDLEFLTGMSALHLSVREKDPRMVRYLLSVGADVNQCCLLVFPIQLAVYYGNEEISQILLDAGADVNATAGKSNEDYIPVTSYKETPLHHIQEIVGRPAVRIALEKGNKHMFDRLLRHDTSKQIASAPLCGWSPWRSAIRGANQHLVRKVFQEYGTMTESVHEGLAECVLSFRYELVKEFINSGSISLADVYHPLVLCAAVARGHKNLVQSLLTDAKTDLGRLPLAYGATAFAVAVSRREFDMFEVFLRAGIKPYEIPVPMTKYFRELLLAGVLRPLAPLRSALGEAYLLSAPSYEAWLSLDPFHPLIDACNWPEANPYEQKMWKNATYSACIGVIERRQRPILETLLAKGIDINGSRPERATLLQIAVDKNAFDIAEYLLELGAEPNYSSISSLKAFITGHTPLQLAASQDHLELFQLLRKYGADPSAKPAIICGATAIQFAAMNGNFQMLNTLLEAGADVNEAPAQFDGRTALEGAAEHGRLNMVKYLLEAGADITGKRNRNYRRTVYRAWTSGHRTITRMVQDWKKERWGVGDCEDTEHIVESMTSDELDFASPLAKLQVEEWLKRDDGEMIAWLQYRRHQEEKFGRKLDEEESRQSKEKLERLRAKLEEADALRAKEEWKRHEQWYNEANQ